MAVFKQDVIEGSRWFDRRSCKYDDIDPGLILTLIGRQVLFEKVSVVKYGVICHSFVYLFV